MTRWLPISLVLAVALAVVAGAIMATGYPVRQLDLNDTGIWISKDSGGEYGRINKAVGALDSRVSPPGVRLANYRLNILQDGYAVLGLDHSNGKLTKIDAATGSSVVDQSIGVDPTSMVSLNGGTLAVMDRSGRVWAGRYRAIDGAVELSSLDPASRPLAELGLPTDAAVGAAGMAVASDGTVFVAGVNGRLITIPVGQDGLAKPKISDALPRLKSIAVTTVGTEAVILDAGSGQVVLPNGQVIAVDADPSARLQQAGPKAAQVLLATTKKLIRIRLDSGAITLIDAQGTGVPAEPVRLGDCDFVTWAGVGRVVRACDNSGAQVHEVARDAPLVRPVFRVNHSLILLNDGADGRAFDLDNWTRVDNWPELQDRTDQSQQKQQTQPGEAKPHAYDDQFKARTERTTVLHPLDNDADTAGGVLAITALTRTDVPAAVKLEVAPDGQTVLIYLPAGFSQTVRFSYQVSNGRAEDEAEVTVTDAGTAQSPPQLRPNYVQPSYSTPSFGNVSIPVLSDWRDPEGDPVTLLSATGEDNSVIPVTADGQIDFTAGDQSKDGLARLTYQVSDNPSASPAKASIGIKVLARKSTNPVAASAQPDVARGEVGKPISIWPLNNDLPGADPRDLTARLAVDGPVAQVANTRVSTDEKTGQVVVIASRAGPYFLSYTVSFGNAAPTRGSIRVDVLKSSSSTPIAVPDQAAIRGRAPVLVDVLANDYDSAGGLLVVQSVTSAKSEQLQAEVIAGRWLRILPTAEDLLPNPQAVHYTISNGSQTASGDVLVTQLREVEQDAPIVRKDTAVVRDGDSVLIAALANDTSLAGQPLKLATDGLGAARDGQLVVIDPTKGADEPQGDVGAAYVRGDRIRYVAPAKVESTRQVVISYTAQTSEGETADSEVLVTIKPQPSAESVDQPPVGTTVEMRVVTGSRVKIPIPTSGQDPDGDSVTVVGIAAAPMLGRVVEISSDSLIYEAYPEVSGVGTDTFRYVITDAYGRTGVGSIRVAVTAPGQTQPPVAIDDQITLAPGVNAELNVMANDLISAADEVSIASLQRLNNPLPAGVSLGGEKGPLVVKAPGAFDQPLLLNYALVGNGGTGAAATVKVVAKEGFNNPPTVTDQTAVVEGKIGKAKLLTDSWDVEGSLDPQQVRALSGAPDLKLIGDELSVPLLDHPQVIPFEVTDAGGAVSAAVVYVPAIGAGAPQLRDGASIEMASNATASFKVGDYVESPRGRLVRISATQAASSPAQQVQAEVVDATSFTLTSKNGYAGPASVTLAVMDAESQTEDGVLMSTVTIPVQVGAKTPVLRCPTQAQTIIQGGEAKNLDITTLCHVWSPDPASLAGLKYTASWAAPIAGVSAVGAEHKVKLQAAGNAAGKATGTLRIGIDGTAAKPAELSVVVVAAPRPKLRSVKFNDILAGTAVSVPISLTSPLIDAQTKIVSIKQIAGPATQFTNDDASMAITAAEQTSGELVFRVVATDLASDPSRNQRWASGTVTLVVYARPDAPGAPRNGPVVQSRAATLSWTPGKANGARIDSYELRASTGRTTTCRSTPCRMAGLTNGQAVTFTVRAHNRAGWSEPSPASKRITPDTAPGAPTAVKVSDPQDRSVLVSWGSISNHGSPIQKVHVMAAGRDIPVSAGQHSVRVPVPSNTSVYRFSVAAENAYDIGPVASVRGQSSGKPLGLSVATPVAVEAVGATGQVKISWSLSSANGPAPASFTVVRSGGKTVCSRVTRQSCVDDSVNLNGASYTYQVSATNGTGGVAHSTTKNSPSWRATGTPDRWGGWSAAETGVNGEVSLSYSVPPSRGGHAELAVMDGESVLTRLGSVPTGGGPSNYRLTELSNGNGYGLKMRVCNEAGRCSSSSVKSVTPFGSLVAPRLSTSVTGSTVSFSASGDANGAGATLTIYVNGVARAADSGTGRLGPSDSLEVGYNTTVTVKAVLSTSATNPARADGGEDSATVTTGSPPRTVTISKSASRSTDTACKYYLDGGRCPYVRISTTGFSGTYTCTIYDAAGHWSSDSRRSKVFTGDVSKDQWYYGYNSDLWVICDGERSANLNW